MMMGGLGFFVTLWLGGFWQGWQWNNPSIPFIDTVVALQADLAGALLLGHADLPGIVMFAYNIMATVVGAGRPEVAARPHKGGLNMLRKADTSARSRSAALVLFFIGGLLTTVVPPLVDKSWAKPFENSDPRRARRQAAAVHGSELKGRAIYVREGCWYCHTQQTRTLLADTKRRGWRGVDSPISTPDEFVYDKPAHVRHQAHRAGPLARRRQVRHAVAPHPLPQSARPGARLDHAAVPVDRGEPAGVHRPGGLHADPRPRQGLASGQGLRKVRRLTMDYTYPSIFFAYLFFALCVALASSSSCARARTGIGARKAKRSSTRMFGRRGRRTMNRQEARRSKGIRRTAGSPSRQGTEVPGFLKLAYLVIARRRRGVLFHLYERRGEPRRPRPAGAAR